MPLKITKAIDPIHVDTIVLCLYAVPGIGRTTTAFSSEKCLLLDFDHGAHRSKFRGDTVQVSKWADVQDMAASDFAPYKTVAVDTIGRALDALSLRIIDDDPKMGMGGALTLKGWGKLKTTFISWLNLLRSYGLDVLLLCHSDEQRDGDELIERLDVQGGSKNEVYKSADAMARLYLKNGKRWLNFSPTDTAFGKNPAGFPPLEVPDFSKTKPGEKPDFLAKTISGIKTELNRLSDEQTAVAEAMEVYKDCFEAANTAEEFTALIQSAKDAPENIRRNVGIMLTHIAKLKGYSLNKEAGRYEQEAAPCSA